MKNKIVLFIFFLFAFNFTAHSQLEKGDLAPDFTATDINGVKYNLYDLLAEGKSVVLDFSATWCGPCWSYKQSGVLESFYDITGPEGTDEAMVFFVESDPTTTMEDLTNPDRDWVTGTNYPIIDDASIGNKFLISSFPTIVLICKNGAIDYVRSFSVDQLVDAVSNCPGSNIPPQIHFFADRQDGCSSLAVQFSSSFWPRPDSVEWDFGDGTKSTMQNPEHTFDSQGDFDVSLAAVNEFGEAIKISESFIHVGLGFSFPEMSVGPVDHNIGSGRYFEGGHQGLVFDAHKPLVISEVTVFSDREKEREIILLDSDGNLLNSKVINIPEGEHRVSLEFYVDEGTDYMLGLYSDAFLFRNDGGVNYPYSINDLVSITKSTASKDGYYYYYYDWGVREAGCSDVNNTEFEFDQNSFSLFPNPANDFLNISFDGLESQDIIIEIYNLQGKLVSRFNDNQKKLSIRDIDEGIYSLIVFNKTIHLNKKLIIVR